MGILLTKKPYNTLLRTIYRVPMFIKDSKKTPKILDTSKIGNVKVPFRTSLRHANTEIPLRIQKVVADSEDPSVYFSNIEQPTFQQSRLCYNKRGILFLSNLFDKSYKKQKENYELNEQVYLIKHKKAKSSIIFSSSNFKFYAARSIKNFLLSSIIFSLKMSIKTPLMIKKEFLKLKMASNEKLT